MGEGPNDKGLSRKHILEGIDASLKRLKTDYVDLLYIHRLDPDTGFEELAEALNDVVRAGKATYLGASSMWTWQFAKLREMQRANGWAQFRVMQDFYNLCYREEEREMIPYCARLKAWRWCHGRRWRAVSWPATSPKTAPAQRRAVRPTRSRKGYFGTRQDYAVLARVEKLATKLDVKPAQIALAWVLAKGITSPIIGATKPHHLERCGRRNGHQADGCSDCVAGSAVRAAQSAGPLVTKQLLIVAHVPSPNTVALRDAAVRGASSSDVSGINVGVEDTVRGGSGRRAGL